MTSSLAYRRAVEADLAYVRHTWMDSMRTSPTAGVIAMSRWSDVMRVELDDILSRPELEVWVAYHPGAAPGDTDLYGWLALERTWIDNRRNRVTASPLLVYVYVKLANRRWGIARGLLRAAGVGPVQHFACKTSDVADLMRAGKLPGARHEHLVLRHPPEAPERPRRRRPRQARANGQSTDCSTAAQAQRNGDP